VPSPSLQAFLSRVSLLPKGITLQHKVPTGLDRKETEVYRQLDPERLPKHIAIIMDGNGRWAKRRHMPRVAGHRAGVAAVRSTVETAARIGIHALTLYAFSEENWKKRPKSEVDFLMRLLSRYLKAEVPTLNKNNIRLEYIGRQHELPEDVQERMAWARHSTTQNTGTVLTLALNYSARSELVDAFRSMVNSVSQNGGLEHLRIDEDTVARHLYTSHLPDPDLVVRTSGEMRLSNFLLWQLAYAEIYVTPTLWPDFRGLHLLEGIAEYQKRERRYGGLNGDSHAHSSPSGEMRASMADLAVELRSNGTNSESNSDSENTDSGNREKPYHSKPHASKVTRKH
jgi:undecaprenyl diphosphate synthase